MSPLRSSAGPAVWTNVHARARRRGSAPARSCPGRAGRPAARGRAPRRAATAASSETASCSRSAVLADELVQRARAQRAVELVLGPSRDAGRRAIRLRRRSSRAPPERAPRAVLGASRPRTSSSSAWGSAGCVAQLQQPSRASRAGPRRGVTLIGVVRVASRRRPSRAARPRCAPPCACRCPARLRRATSPAASAREVARRPAAQHRQRHLRPDGLHADAAAGRAHAPPRGEAVEGQRVIADHEVGVQRHRAPDGRDVTQRLARHRQA